LNDTCSVTTGGEDGRLVVVGVRGVPLSGTLRGGGHSVDGASLVVDDLPLGALAARHAGGREVRGEPVLHEVHACSVHLEAVVAVGGLAGVRLAVVVVHGGVGGDGLGDAEGLSAELAWSGVTTVLVNICLSATRCSLSGASFGRELISKSCCRNSSCFVMSKASTTV
jgi:hypothetical protein